jgi:hypothetical protein
VHGDEHEEGPARKLVLLDGQQGKQQQNDQQLQSLQNYRTSADVE